jgi:hypothetical protein
MKRRELVAGLAGASFLGSLAEGAAGSNTYIELKTWRLHNSAEQQSERVADFIENGLMPAMTRSGCKLAGAFANLIGPDGPCYVTLTEYASMGTMQDALSKLASDQAYQSAVEKLGRAPGLPFVRVESSLLRSFDVMPQAAISPKRGREAPRIFELRTYESQSFATLRRKIGMFNESEARIFERLGMRPGRLSLALGSRILRTCFRTTI